MTRREVLTAVELTAVTVVLGASLPILAHAANYGASWGAPALAGALVLAMLLTPVTLLVLLVLTAQGLRIWRLRREVAALPPSARTPLQVPGRRDDTMFDAYAVEYMREARQSAAYAMGDAGATGRHAAPAVSIGGGQ